MAFYQGCVVGGKMSDSISDLSNASDTDADLSKISDSDSRNVNEVWLSTNL